MPTMAVNLNLLRVSVSVIFNLNGLLSHTNSRALLLKELCLQCGLLSSTASGFRF